VEISVKRNGRVHRTLILYVPETSEIFKLACAAVEKAAETELLDVIPEAVEQS